MRRLLILFLLLYGASAWAGDTKPPEIAATIHAAIPYGEGTYIRLWMDVYKAELWTDAATWSPQTPFALTLRYHMHFTGRELADRSITEMQHIAPLSPKQADNFRARLTQLFPNVKKGDEITALYIPHKGAQFFYNGKPTGTIPDDALAQRFLNIWLSEKTSAPDLRKRLLSGHHP